jgi:hypothetical protein
MIKTFPHYEKQTKHTAAVSAVNYGLFTVYSVMKFLNMYALNLLMNLLISSFKSARINDLEGQQMKQH